MRVTSEQREAWRKHLHKCAAVHCERQIRTSMLMCAAHWWLVPPKLRRTITAGYLEFLKSGVFTEEYIAAREKAVELVSYRVGENFPR